MRDPKETQLLLRLRAGDDRAMADVADAYSTKIYQLAFRYLRNREDAEEVMQDVLYKVYRKVGDFRGDAALSSWIYRITFNAAMSRVRTAHYRRSQDGDRRASLLNREETGAAARADVADRSDMADEQLLRLQLRQRVLHAILRLPAIYRAPVMLRDTQGMSTEEASAMLRVKEETLKSRLHRGRLILRKELVDFAGGLSLHRPAGLRHVRDAGCSVPCAAPRGGVRRPRIRPLRPSSPVAPNTITRTPHGTKHALEHHRVLER